MARSGRLILAAALAASSLAWAAGAAKPDYLEQGSHFSRVLKLITRTVETLDVEMFLFTDKKVIDAVLNAANRGVRVRVLLEPSMQSNRKIASKFKRKRIELRWFKPNAEEPKGRLHGRAACSDKKLLLAGSADWTSSSLHRDRETVLLVQGEAALVNWQADFEQVWERAYGEIPRKWALMDELEALPNPRDLMNDEPKVNSRRGG